MYNINLHLTDYDQLGENRTVSSRLVSLPTIPGQGAYLLTSEKGRTKPYFVTSLYVPVDDHGAVAAHVFAMRTSAPVQEAERVGMKGNDLGVPSLTSFEGSTVADLMSFLSDYPAEDKVFFEDRQVLVAKSKGNDLILRLDPTE